MLYFFTLVCEGSHDPKIGVAMLLVRAEACSKLHDMEISVGGAWIQFCRKMMRIRRSKRYDG